MLADCDVDVGEFVHVCRFAKVNGIAYYKNMYVVVSCEGDTLVFGRIQGIFVQDMMPLFCLHLFNNTYYAHLSGYLLKSTTARVIVTHNKFLDYYPLTAYDVKGCKYVVMKNLAFDECEYQLLSSEN
jgi:hypothetical protein